MTISDRDLGMDRNISRRDFVDGAAVAVAAAVSGAGSHALAATPPPASDFDPNYPPGLQGLRGQNDEALQHAHALRDGASVGAPNDTREAYDLVIVGAGLSGLSAAYFYRKEMPSARVLILDNHDDFGGHARRNHFNVDGREVIAWGGTYTILDVASWSNSGRQLLQEVGIDYPAFEADAKANPAPYRNLGMGTACFFDRETYGRDRLVMGFPEFAGFAPAARSGSWEEFLAKAPVSRRLREDLLKIYTETRDYMPGVSREEKIARLQKMSYEDYLTKVVGVQADAIKFIYHLDFHNLNAGGGPDSYSAYSAWRRRKGGFKGMDLGEAPAATWTSDQSFSMHLPDGNGGLARLMVRWLIPEALPGRTMQDAYGQNVNYSMLDRPNNPVRIRLSSTVVNVRHNGDPARANDVQVSYIRNGQVYSVRAGGVVMACFNAMVPHLCPDLPQAQKEALHLSVRMPLTYTTVALRNWRAHAKLGVANIYFPSGLLTAAGLDSGTGVGPYKRAQTPDEPTFLNMWMWPLQPGTGLPWRDQFKAGRQRLLELKFEDFERDLRRNLGRALGAGDFDPARDIAGITVNRWGHGYAGSSNGLFDPDWSREEKPWVVGRKRFGRITIANSDAGATCLTPVAIDQAHRAVTEILTDVQRTDFQYPWGTRL